MASRSRTPDAAYQGHATTDEMASTTARQAAQQTRPPTLHRHPLELLPIAGLAGVFLVNALVALVEPTDVMGLVERSVVGRVLPAMTGRWVAWAIAVNDVLIGTLLLATIWIPRFRPFILAWAGAWLLAVSLVKLTSLEALGG